MKPTVHNTITNIFVNEVEIHAAASCCHAIVLLDGRGLPVTVNRRLRRNNNILLSGADVGRRSSRGRNRCVRGGCGVMDVVDKWHEFGQIFNMGRITCNPPLRSMMGSLLNSIRDVSVHSVVHASNSCCTHICLG